MILYQPFSFDTISATSPLFKVPIISLEVDELFLTLSLEAVTFPVLITGREFEFIIENDSKIIPLDVKKNKGSLNSLEKFKEHNKLDYAIKISSNNYGYDENNKIITIPFYELFLLLKDLSKNDLK